MRPEQTRRREADVGYRPSLGGDTMSALELNAVSTKLQRIAQLAKRDPFIAGDTGGLLF